MPLVNYYRISPTQSQSKSTWS